MKEHVAITQEPGHLSTRSSVWGIIGQICKLMLKHTSRSTTNANGLVTSLDTIRVPHLDDGIVALCTMGTRHFGSIPSGHKADEVSSGGHRLFHQMGGS